MRIRHKQPTLVSMWMLDVFCCALGCVILLLLLKMREARVAADEARNSSSDLDGARIQLMESDFNNLALAAEVSDRDGRLALLKTERDDLAKYLALARNEKDDLAKNLALVRDARDDLAKKLALAEKDADAAAKQLALVRTQKDDVAKRLATAEEALRSAAAELALARTKLDASAKALALARQKSSADAAELAELARKVTTDRKDQDELQMLVREKEKLRAAAIRDLLATNERLLSAEAKLKESLRTVDDLMAKSGDAAKMRARLGDLEKQLAEANVAIVDLQGTKAKLADKVNKLEVEAEQRFAGIAMTGKKVVFLVDMSGSMDRTDENTVNATKWPTVRETLLKVMRTLPDLEQFQVVLFSNEVTYLLGGRGQWLPYERDKSIEQVRKAMAAVKPVGGTNLHAAFQETFLRYRGLGLDTVYLFSDGLPTIGPGLTPQQEERLTDAEKGVLLAPPLRKEIRNAWNLPGPSRSRVRINSIGFFFESPDVGAFLWALSRENDGSFVGMSRP
jgi:hypothetical protein